jgi:multiple sugar transport system substrate-binding protein
MEKIILKGITWGHSRGITPLLAYSQRFSELYPGVEVVWKKRTLQEFADYPIEELTGQYDLLIIDHPWVGQAAATACVLPLDEHLSGEYLNNQLQNSTGASHLSYFYEGHQWALAIDAATPAASYRADLFKKNHAALPYDWSDLIYLAKKGKVAAPAIAIDLLMNFYMFCIAHGREPFSNDEEVIDMSTGLQALETMRQLYSLLDKKMFSCNPIAVAELMTGTDDYWYCPFAYCYSNYSREGYAKAILHYTGLIELNGKKLRSTIGGTGIAVSAFSNHKEWAVKFAEEICSEKCQSTFYVQHGGQPGHKSAWLNEDANRWCNDFFKNVLPVMENGYLRPRYNGYLYFQDHAGEPLHHYLLNGGNAQKVLEKINQIYQQSLQPHLSKTIA